MSEASPPSRAGLPGKEDCHFCIAPLDPALPDGACGEQAGQPPIIPLKPIPIKDRISMIFIYYGRIDVLRGCTFVERGQ
jgi:hypothetical protein